MQNQRLRKITRILMAVTIAILVSATFLTQWLYRLWEGKNISLPQSLLFVLQTLTTTGYGELLPFYLLGNESICCRTDGHRPGDHLYRFGYRSG